MNHVSRTRVRSSGVGYTSASMNARCLGRKASDLIPEELAVGGPVPTQVQQDMGNSQTDVPLLLVTAEDADPSKGKQSMWFSGCLAVTGLAVCMSGCLAIWLSGSQPSLWLSACQAARLSSCLAF